MAKSDALNGIYFTTTERLSGKRVNNSEGQRSTVFLFSALQVPTGNVNSTERDVVL